jgi:hypothetical protein
LSRYQQEYGMEGSAGLRSGLLTTAATSAITPSEYSAAQLTLELFTLF